MLLNVPARFSIAFIVYGCSTPGILFLASRTWISSCSASVYFPRLLYVNARFAMALIVSRFSCSQNWNVKFLCLCEFS